jgi:hypothetical protein
MAKRRRGKEAADGAVQGALFGADEVAYKPDLQPGAYAAYEPPVAVADAARDPPGNLRVEIAVVRAMLADVLRLPLAPDKRAAVVGTLLATLARLMRENRELDGSAGDPLEATQQEVLNDPATGLAAGRAERTAV